MKMKKISGIFTTVMVLFVVLAVFTGCSNNVDETVSTGFVRFDGRTDASRSLTQKDANIYKIEDLYWTYTAKKIDGLYTEGESAKIDTVKGILNPGTGSTVYVERPVKDGPATGLDAQVGPFATGDWEFKIYGYVNCVVEDGVAKYETLVYTGVTSPVNIAVKQLTGTPVVIPEVAFELTATDEVPVTGTLAFDRVKLTLPETDGLFSKTTSEATGLKKPDGSAYQDVDTVVKVRVWDVTGGAVPSASNLVATSETPITADYKTGDVVDLYPFEIVSGKETVVVNDTYKGTHTFLFAAEYQDRYTKYASEYVAKPVGSTVYDTYLYKYDTEAYESKIYENGFAPVGEVKAFMVQFYSGSVTTVSGDINDMVDATEGGSPAKFGVAVARILKNGVTGTITDASYDYYATLADAFAAYSAPARPVIILADVKDETIVMPSKDVAVSNPDLKSLKNVEFSGAHNAVFTLGSGTPTRTYKFQDGKLVNFMCNATHAYVETSGGKLDVTATSDNVIHTGTAVDITVKGAESYKVSADVTGTLELAAGHVEISEYVSVATVNVTATSSTNASIQGYKTSSVGNMTSIRDGGNAKGGIFKQVILNANVGTGTTSVTKYGIEGMYVELPQFRTGSAGSPIFTNGKLTLADWNTSANGSGDIYADCSKVVAGGSVNNLYVQWTLPVGGVIYYVHYEDNGASYRFYDENGVKFESEGRRFTADDLRNAVSYTVTGKSSGDADVFYVYNSEHGVIDSIAWGALAPSPDYAGFGDKCGSCLLLDGVWDKSGATPVYSIPRWPDGMKMIGQGKILTAKALDKTTPVELVVFNTAPDHLARTRYEAATNTSTGYTAGTPTMTKNTIFSYIDYLNNGNSDGRFVSSQCAWLSKSTAPGGCTDWYIPGVAEYEELAVWCGLAKKVGLLDYVVSEVDVSADTLKSTVKTKIKGAVMYVCAENGCNSAMCTNGGVGLGGSTKGYYRSVFAIRSF